MEIRNELVTFEDVKNVFSKYITSPQDQALIEKAYLFADKKHTFQIPAVSLAFSLWLSFPFAFTSFRRIRQRSNNRRICRCGGCGDYHRDFRFKMLCFGL